MSTNKFHAKSTALEVVEGHDLTGYEIVVTGGASGIGVETVRAFAKANARVVLAARDLKKAQEVADEIIKSTGNVKVEVESLDLASLKNVRAFVERFLAKNRPLNILVNNAGI
jgi:NAD(P)-dependent dehydrogenase (short-subunit alcohol dehydrogenase family)